MSKGARQSLVALLVWLAAYGQAFAQPRGPLVLAASSLQESLTEAANVWAARGHARPVISFAASPALARQILAGAPADLFISADPDWMDEVAAQRLIRPATRAVLVTNRLALIAPGDSKARLTIAPGFPLASALGNGRLAMADPASVPAGKYGKQALISLKAWAGVAPRLAAAENVRAALSLVERGAAPFGIVYATDARAARGVKLIGLFPASSHSPIRFQIATLSSARHREAEAFRRFLLSPQGKAIFARYGFGT